MAIEIEDALAQAEARFCRLIDEHVDPNSFFGDNCNNCLVGQIGYAVGAFEPVEMDNGMFMPNGFFAGLTAIPHALADHLFDGEWESPEHEYFRDQVYDVYMGVSELNFEDARAYAREVMEIQRRPEIYSGPES